MALIAQTKSCPVLKSGSCATMERNIGEASLQGCFKHMYRTYIVSDKRTYTNNGTRVANNIIAESGCCMPYIEKKKSRRRKIAEDAACDQRKKRRVGRRGVK
jgi:hypothetical protein